ncbi:MAG: hypothetical protein LQ350_000827 [Teloschistes chrysophthalmus]|nr:MAG: hypothetical protein LQ350_000827 [Niorma chrysophthalma]
MGGSLLHFLRFSTILSALCFICGTLAVIPPLPEQFSGIADVDAAYDYVIVGGGTSGLTVAKRLAEDPAVSVAVIEAGGFYEIESGNVSQIPAYATSNIAGNVSNAPPFIDWKFVTTPQPALNGREVFYAQGKTLGGSGTKGAYQKWADTVGDQSFSFENFVTYFKKSPQFTPIKEINESAVFSRSGGPLHVSYSHYVQPFTPFIRSALLKLGLKSIEGFNSGNLLGFASYSFTIDPATETRSSSETSFLRTAVTEREHLVIYNHTNAERILFDRGRRATGVFVSTAGKEYTLTARKEVVVAAGVFKTPQLLMVSGIGPPKTLRRFGIPVISALNGVGQNLWDQPFFGIGYRINVTSQLRLNDPSYLQQSNQEYIQNQTGPLTSIGASIIGFSKVPPKYRSTFSKSTLKDFAQFPPDWPELELLPSAGATFPVNDTADYASFTIADVAPLSRGNVTIRSAKTSDPPLISPNWLLSKTDQEVAVAGFKVARDIAGGSGITVGEEVRPGVGVQTDGEILAFLRETASTIHHASATCEMPLSPSPFAPSKSGHH